MKVLVACEFSGRVRDAFLNLGHDAWSVDLLPTETPGPHLRCDVLDAQAWDCWDLMVAFPPCTYLAVSGARWHSKTERQAEALTFVRRLLDCRIPRIALENPVGAINSQIRRPDQIVHPWEFGHGETKATCLWLKGLPPLMPTELVSERRARVHREPDSKDRWKRRSRTYPGIAAAMAAQWG